MEVTISDVQKTAGMTYRGAGVDIDAGDALIGRISDDAKRTRRSGADGSLGGFGALFDLKAAGFSDPILVAATDGVGTKLELARQAGQYRGLGIDLVAMCANDILAQGAAPLFFLDYYATGALDGDQAAAVIAGIADGCLMAGAALIGGETAEMPGVYPNGGFDLAGFCVGAAERGRLLNPDDTASGQVAIAIASNGVHSNGYSLVRRLLDHAGLTPSDAAPFAPDETIADQFLAPTTIYTNAVMPLIKDNLVTSISHITGGGLVENPHRVFAADLALDIDMLSWTLPPLFAWMQHVGQIEDMELLRTFNCGIGMIVTVDPKHSKQVMEMILAAGYDAWTLGMLSERGENDAPVRFHDLEQWQKS